MSMEELRTFQKIINLLTMYNMELLPFTFFRNSPKNRKKSMSKPDSG